MNLQQEFIVSQTMTHTKAEILEHIKKNNIYFPPYLESKLLKWNCYPLINFSTRDLEISFGVFFFQMLKLSQNQKVKDQFQDLNKMNLKDLQLDQFIYLCHWIFQKQSLNPFPQSFEFKPIGDLIQESFIYEKHIQDKTPSYYKSLNGTQVLEINEQDLKYRILLYVNGDQQGNIAHIIFSTNQNIDTLFSIPNIQNFNTKNQMQFQQPQFSQYPQSNQPIQKQIFTQSTQINQQQVQNGQLQKDITSLQSNANQKWQLLKNHNAFSQMIFTQQQQQQNPMKKFFQTSVTNSCNFNNFPKESSSQIKLTPNQNQNERQQPITGSIQQFQDQFQNLNLQNQFPKQQDKFNSNLNISTQQVTEEEVVFCTQQINNLEENESINNQVLQSRILTNLIQQKQQNVLDCIICTMKYNLDLDESIVTPCCNKKVHVCCYQQDLDQKAKINMSFEKITCYSCGQSFNNRQDFLKKNISIALFGEIVKRRVLADIPMKCCKCQQAIKASQEILNKQVKLQCFQCNTMLCSLCRQEYHGQNQQNQQCPSLAKEIQKAFQGMPILLCPFCQLIQTKDDKCNHVKCFNCKRDLCSACSVDRIPIVAHGNHYHREGCPDYKPWIVKDKINKTKEFDKIKCQRCKESGKPCEYPMSLEEYRKLKQF